jgi:protein gp37
MAHDIAYWEHHTAEWMEKSWNPITGCTKISEACLNCYGESMVKAFVKRGWHKCYPKDDPYKLTVHDGTHDEIDSNMDRFAQDYGTHPSSDKSPHRYFVVDIGDIFHEDLPFETIRQVFEVMYEFNQHLYIVLTKRSARMRELAPRLEWPENIVAGVTVELPKYYNRMDDLRAVPATTRMIMVEPILSFLPEINFGGIDQVVCGGESISNEHKLKLRPPDPNWVRDLRDQCASADVSFMFKQWGGTTNNKKDNGCVLDGEVWRQWPEQIRKWNEARGFEYIIKEGDKIIERI